MRKYKNQYWSVNVPTLWDAEYSVDEQADIVYDNNGIGELFISTIYQEEGVSEEQLEAMASEHINADAEIDDVECGDFTGITVSYIKESEYWCEWYLCSDNVLLFISYNCNDDNAEEDEDVVESILDSLEVL